MNFVLIRNLVLFILLFFFSLHLSLSGLLGSVWVAKKESHIKFSPISLSEKVFYLGSNSFDHKNLDYLKDLQEDVSLIFFDAHSDAAKNTQKLNCGTWINFAVHLPNVKNIFWLGGAIGIAKETGFWLNEEIVTSGDFRVFPARSFTSYVKSTSAFDNVICESVRKDRIASFAGFPGYHIRWLNFRQALGKLKEFGCHRKIFITIDLDVLDEKYGKTPWGNGILKEEELIKAIFFLEDNFEVQGITFCGPQETFERIFNAIRRKYEQI